MLRCFVVATTHTATFSIEVEEGDTIDEVKKRIKANDDYVFGEHDEYTLWKINLPKKEYREEAGPVRGYTPFSLSVKEVLGGEELNNPKRRIREIFLEGLANDSFHLAVLINPVANDSVYMFVDDSNLFIQGKYAVGTKERLGRTTERGFRLDEFRIDHGKLLEIVLSGRPRGSKPILVGSRPPRDENLWDFIREKDYYVNSLDRNAQDREKGVDSTLGQAISSTVSSHLPGVLVLVAGDRDYYPYLTPALDRKWKIEVWFWRKGIKFELISQSIEYANHCYVSFAGTSHAFFSTTSGNREITSSFQRGASHKNMVEFRPLDDYYTSFSYGYGNPSPKYNFVSLTLIGENLNGLENGYILECFRELSVFGWLKWEDNFTVCLYFKKKALGRVTKWIRENWVETGPKMEMWENV